MSDMSEYEPPTGQIDTLTGVSGNGLPPLVVTADGYEDDDLDAAEALDEVADDDGGADDEFAELHAKTETLEDLYRQQEAARVRRKVTTAPIGGGVASAIPAVLSASAALNLPDDVQSIITVVAAILGAFVGGYFVPERPQPLGPAR
jgi:hypothetical protein